MGDVKFTGRSDFEKVKKDYEDLARKTAKVENENRKLKAAVEKNDQAQQRQARRHQTAMERGVSGIRSMISGYVGLETAVRLVTSAIQEQQAIQREVLDANISTAKADAQVVRNLAGESSGVKKDTLDALKQIAKDTGSSSEAAVKLGFSSAVSKSGGDRELALRATKAAAQIEKQSPEGLGASAAGAVVISRLAGTSDPREALGFLAQVQGRSPITDPTQALRSLPSAIGGVTGTDARGGTRDSVRAAGALFAALGTAASDDQGSATATASIQFAGQLREFFKGRQDPGTVEARIKQLQGNQEQQKEFLSGLTGEQKFRVPFEQLVKGIGIVSREFDTNLKSLSLEGGRKEFEQQAKEVSGLTESLQIATTQAAKDQQVEAAKLSRPGLARIQQAREQVKEAIKLSSEGIGSFVDRQSLGLEFETRVSVGQDARQAGIQVLKARQRQIRGGLLASFLGPTTRGLPFVADLASRGDDWLGEGEKRRIADLEQAIQTLQADLSQQRATNAGQHRAAALGELSASRSE